jgi:hypothetical protein
MDVFAVFRRGRWVDYVPSLTALTDPRWTDTQRHLAASVYASLLSKGFEAERAHQVSEAYIFKTLYAELKYSKGIEQDLLVARE